MGQDWTCSKRLDRTEIGLDRIRLDWTGLGLNNMIRPEKTEFKNNGQI